MGACLNYGPFFGYPKYEVPYSSRDPKRDHDFDNHPNGQQELQSEMETPFIQGLHGDFRNFSSGDHSSKETNLILGFRVSLPP